MKRNKNYQTPRQITVLAQTSIELFPVVTCSLKNCEKGNPTIQPALLVNGFEKFYMHHMGSECTDCKHLDEFWHLRLQALS